MDQVFDPLSWLGIGTCAQKRLILWTADLFESIKSRFYSMSYMGNQDVMRTPSVLFEPSLCLQVRLWHRKSRVAALLWHNGSGSPALHEQGRRAYFAGRSQETQDSVCTTLHGDEHVVLAGLLPHVESYWRRQDAVTSRSASRVSLLQHHLNLHTVPLYEIDPEEGLFQNFIWEIK